MPFIRVTLDDIALANRLAPELLGRIARRVAAADAAAATRRSRPWSGSGATQRERSSSELAFFSRRDLRDAAGLELTPDPGAPGAVAGTRIHRGALRPHGRAVQVRTADRLPTKPPTSPISACWTWRNYESGTTSNLYGKKRPPVGGCRNAPDRFNPLNNRVLRSTCRPVGNAHLERRWPPSCHSHESTDQRLRKGPAHAALGGQERRLRRRARRLRPLALRTRWRASLTNGSGGWRNAPTRRAPSRPTSGRCGCSCAGPKSATCARPSQITRPILESYQRWLFRYRQENGKPLGVTTQRDAAGRGADGSSPGCARTTGWTPIPPPIWSCPESRTDRCPRRCRWPKSTPS